MILHLTVKQIGEVGLLQIVQRYCPAGIVGDDAAVLDPVPGQLVITTDVLVEDVHFSNQTTPALSVGWRAAAANLSDLAAMGADPLGLVIGLGLPGSTLVDWVDQLYQGIQSCCQPWQVLIVGGDLCRSATRFVSITAWGQVEPGQTIWRRQAQPGDALVVTGPHGSSRAGLELLLHHNHDLDLSDPERQRLIKAHQFPQPRLDVVSVLGHLACPRVGGMDTSDGLADALIQVCAASKVNAVVWPEVVPMDPALVAGFPNQALDWALYGGEDFELLLSLPAEFLSAFLSQVPGSVQIGQVISRSESTGEVELKGIGKLTRDQSFQHFA